MRMHRGVRAGQDSVVSRRVGMVALAAVVLLLSGCSQPLSTREKSTIGGGLIGGAAGSLIGAAVGSPGAGEIGRAHV